MIRTVAAVAIAFVMASSLSARADMSADCEKSWTNMDAKKAGFLTAEEAKEEMAAMKTANRKTAAEDRLDAKEYMDACIAEVFKPRDGLNNQ